MSPDAPPDKPRRKRSKSYRRRLRSRIALSFFLLGFGLTALFGMIAIYASARVEDEVVGDALKRNINSYADRFYKDRSEVLEPLSEIRARVYGPDKRENVPPDWAELESGVYQMNGEEDGKPFVYRLVVRKDPEYWFFLAYDLTQTVENRRKQQWVIVMLIGAFSLVSLLTGLWAASRVMSPVSELARRVKLLGRSSRAEGLARHFSDDEVGQLAQALDDYARRLTHVVERDREFNADVSHELRTPLTIIKGAAELLLSRSDLEDKIRNRLLRIQRAEQQCSDLISALLLLSRNERGHGSTDIARLSEQLLEAHQAQLGGKPLTLRVEGERGLSADAPEAVVAVALGNLISNAVKYTNEGEVVVRLGRNAVEVIDSGPGLSAEDAAKLFERGYRGTHAGHSQGGGIGLSIVRRLCDLYGWDVRVKPGVSRGVIATLTFERPPEPESEPAA